jgi:hypothetical protein
MSGNRLIILSKLSPVVLVESQSQSCRASLQGPTTLYGRLVESRLRIRFRRLRNLCLLLSTITGGLNMIPHAMVSMDRL